jgi:hypothetical protein
MAAKNDSTAVLLAWSEMVPATEGQDPLGLNLRVSARLAAQLLHCITSITPRARYFSFFSWCVADFDRREKTERADADFREALRLREKALTMGCVLHHDGEACQGGGLVGSEAAMTWLASHSNQTPKFSQLKFVKNPAMDAYFNSMVHLGFFVADVEQTSEIETEEQPEIAVADLELTDLGRRVAMAYDQAVGKLPVAMKLAKQPDGCKPDELKKWGAAGGLCELSDASAPDRDLLREVFFNHVGSPGESHLFRHDSLTLLLELIRQLEPHGLELTPFLFNDATYLGAVRQDDELPVTQITWPKPLQDSAERWRMFHFHYYCAVALESLFVGVVSQARSSGMKGFKLETLVENLKGKSVASFLEKKFGQKMKGAFLDSTPRQLFALTGVASLDPEQEKNGELVSILDLTHPLCETNLDADFYGDIDRNAPEGMVCSLLMLIVAATRFTRYEKTDYAKWLARAAEDPYKDVTVPIVLRELRQQFGNYLDATWRGIALFVTRRFVVRQHEVLAYDKNWDGSRAFFHTEQDHIRWRQLNYDQIGVNNSRFSRALQILQDLGLVLHDEADKRLFKLTADGKAQLKRELAGMEQK